MKDVRSSQRCESMNSVVGKKTTKGTSLPELYGVVEATSTTQSRKHRKHQNKSVRFNMIGRSKAFIKLDGHLTHFALQKAAREDERLLHYFTKIARRGFALRGSSRRS